MSLKQGNVHECWCVEHQWGPHPPVEPTEETLEKEIAENSPPGYWGFLPEEWRKLRKEGYPPCAIDYDMCHVFR